MNIARLASKNISIMRATVMQYIVTPEEFEYYASLSLSLVKDGKLKIKIHKVYDLKDAKQAQDDLEGRATSGKLLLKI
jgi:NADPH2:quinone reductase